MQTLHVSSMSADYGGTEIRSGLGAVFASRNTHVSTAVFVLTDGEVNAVAFYLVLVAYLLIPGH